MLHVSLVRSTIFAFLFSLFLAFWLIDDRRSCSVAGQTRTAELLFLATTGSMHATVVSHDTSASSIRAHTNVRTTFSFSPMVNLTERLILCAVLRIFQAPSHCNRQVCTVQDKPSVETLHPLSLESSHGNTLHVVVVFFRTISKEFQI
jgi:hypothetical protein